MCDIPAKSGEKNDEMVRIFYTRNAITNKDFFLPYIHLMFYKSTQRSFEPYELMRVPKCDAFNKPKMLHIILKDYCSVSCFDGKIAKLKILRLLQKIYRQKYMHTSGK